MGLQLNTIDMGTHKIEYTIREEYGCTIVIADSIPLSVFSKLTGDETDGRKILDPHLARIIDGAIMVWGTPEDLKTATEHYSKVAMQSFMENATPDVLAMGKDACEWLAIGEQGKSSCVLFWQTTGYKPRYIRNEYDPEKCYPRDPDDLGRCRRLIENVTVVRDNLQKMCSCGPVWSALMDQWDDLCDDMDTAAPQWREKIGSAQSTLNMMNSIITTAGKNSAD